MNAKSKMTWYTMGGNNARSGTIEAQCTIRRKTPRKLEAQGGVFGSAVLTDEGTVLFADMSGSVHAYAEDGKLLWRKTVDGGVHAAPTFNRVTNTLYVGTVTGNVYALDAITGEQIWHQSLAGKYDPRILSDLLVIPEKKILVLSSWEWKYFAIDAETGKTKFDWPAGPSPRASASADSDGMIFTVRAEYERGRGAKRGVHLVRINPDSGDETSVFFHPFDESVPYAPVLVAAPVIDTKRNLVYCITNIYKDSLLHSVDPASGEGKWSCHFERNVYATPALLQDGRIAVGDLSGDVHCLNPDGSLSYRYKTGSYFIFGGPVSDGGGTVYVGDSEGKIHRINPKGIGEPFFEAERCIEARPAFQPDGSLLVPSTDGNVYIFS